MDNIMRAVIFFISVLLAVNFCSCKGDFNTYTSKVNGNEIEVRLEKHSDSLYDIKLIVNGILNSTWELKYPVYRFDFGDVTGDNIPEIGVGVTKTTRFDPKLDKRLFLFRITDDYYIRPLWLGSRVAQPLTDFRIIENDSTGFIRTIEREKSGKYLTANYCWRGFGLHFTNYIEREIDEKQARKLMNDKTIK